MVTGKHARLWNARTVAVALGAPAPSAPRHRANVWKVIAQTPRYTLLENTLTGETRTSWALDDVRVGAEL